MKPLPSHLAQQPSSLQSPHAGPVLSYQQTQVPLCALLTRPREAPLQEPRGPELSWLPNKWCPSGEGQRQSSESLYTSWCLGTSQTHLKTLAVYAQGNSSALPRHPSPHVPVLLKATHVLGSSATSPVPECGLTSRLLPVLLGMTPAEPYRLSN